ncbi:carbohydrate-binding protein [Kitasatospora sp. NPDC094015]|uniref:carbohydrate-binding protein n=1 Tax=Kitasatospora sp. NPDC094015 TaxID=3155205 RepID=UPI0033308271
MPRPSRRKLLAAALGTAAAAALPAPAFAAGSSLAVSSWKLRWAPDPATDGLAAFETVEDDRAGSHPAGHPHILPQGDAYRWNMHLVDRDTTTDRQRQEVTGMRSPAGGPALEWLPGQSWRVTYAMFIPSSLRATTTWSDVLQLKQPGTGTLPILVQGLRRAGGAQTIELTMPIAGLHIGDTGLDPLHDTWVDVDLRITVGDRTSGSVRWVLRRAGATVIDVSRSGVDTFLADRVRPKWGIYRSLNDTSGSLRDCYLLTRDMRGYQLVSGSSGVYQAEEARISQGTVETEHPGYSGSGYVNLANTEGSYLEWTVQAGAASGAALDLRHANGSPAARPMDISVNGAVVGAGRPFAPTGGWDTWATTSLPITLRAGTNTIRATATTAAGGPNLDRITVR